MTTIRFRRSFESGLQFSRTSKIVANKWFIVNSARYFENLSTEEAKDIFEREFVKAFNKGKLPAMYYSGDIPVELQQRATHTRHK